MFAIVLFIIVQRVIRPQGDINKLLQWLPVSLHKKLENVRKLISKDSLPTQIAGSGQRLMPLPAERQGTMGFFKFTHT